MKNGNSFQIKQIFYGFLHAKCTKEVKHKLKILQVIGKGHTQPDTIFNVIAHLLKAKVQN